MGLRNRGTAPTRALWPQRRVAWWSDYGTQLDRSWRSIRIGCVLPKRKAYCVGFKRQDSQVVGCRNREPGAITSWRTWEFGQVCHILPRWKARRVRVKWYDDPVVECRNPSRGTSGSCYCEQRRLSNDYKTGFAFRHRIMVFWSLSNSSVGFPKVHTEVLQPPMFN